MGKIKKNSVQGTRRGKKYSEAIKTACMCDLLRENNLSDVAKRYGVPESTLRTWQSKAAALDAQGQKSLWAKAREEQIQQITLKASQGARLGTEMMVRRLESGERNLRRCEEIDRIILGADESDGLVYMGGQAVGEMRKETVLGYNFAEKLKEERQKRKENTVSDFTLSNYLRTLTAVSAKGAGEVQSGGGGARYEDYLSRVTGEEF